MPACQRPGCSREQAGTVLLHRRLRRAELLVLGDAVGDRYGTALCAMHLDRAKLPSGWTLVDRRALPQSPAPSAPTRPRVHGAPPGSSTNSGAPVWTPQRGRDDPDELSSARSPLLRRAFLGSTESLAEPARESPARVESAVHDDEPAVGQLRLAV